MCSMNGNVRTQTHGSVFCNSSPRNRGSFARACPSATFNVWRWRGRGTGLSRTSIPTVRCTCVAATTPRNHRVDAQPMKEFLSVALCDQIKSLDWTAREAEFICELPEDTLADIMGKTLALLK